MSTQTASTVPTQFAEVDGIRFAYRRWGKPGGFPVVFFNYFTGNLDDWDPLITDGFADDHEVILFNNAGVASSGGKTPDTVAKMTRDAIAFCDALDLNQFHVVGFSLGGMIAQQMALDHPDRIRRILLVGTGPQGGEGMEFAELSAEEQADPVKLVLAAFFSPTETSQAAGRAYLQRSSARAHDRDLPVSPKTGEAQLRAIREWGRVPSRDRYASLKHITHSTLIVHGNKDVVVQPVNALILAQHLPNAQLIVYPDSIPSDKVQVFTANGMLPATPNRALSADELPGIVELYHRAAERAKIAGFDGAEILAAGGYLLDQFLQNGTNQRTDRYGGTVENRARLLIEVTSAVAEVWGADRVGVRISPSGTFNGISDSEPESIFDHVAGALDQFGLAYLHIIEPRVRGGSTVDAGRPPVAAVRLRRIFSGPIIAAGGFDPAGAAAIVDNGDADLVAFGRHFIANPDLPARIAGGQPLNPYDRSTFYTGGIRGYTDYPFLTQIVGGNK